MSEVKRFYALENELKSLDKSKINDVDYMLDKSLKLYQLIGNLCHNHPSNNEDEKFWECMWQYFLKYLLYFTMEIAYHDGNKDFDEDDIVMACKLLELEYCALDHADYLSGAMQNAILMDSFLKEATSTKGFIDSFYNECKARLVNPVFLIGANSIKESTYKYNKE